MHYGKRKKIAVRIVPPGKKNSTSGTSGPINTRNKIGPAYRNTCTKHSLIEMKNQQKWRLKIQSIWDTGIGTDPKKLTGERPRLRPKTVIQGKRDGDQKACAKLGLEWGGGEKREGCRRGGEGRNGGRGNEEEWIKGTGCDGSRWQWGIEG